MTALEKTEEWVDNYLRSLKTDEDRKIFLDIKDRAYKLGHPKDFFNLLLLMLLAQQAEIEALVLRTR